MRNLFCIILLIIHISGFPQNEWKLKKDRDGILFYTRKVESSFMREFKGTMEMSSTLSATVSVFKDVDSFKNWMPDTRTAELLHSEGDSLQIHYIETEAPWPFLNRDAVCYFFYSQDSLSKTVIITMTGMPDYIPKKHGKIRIPKANGRWEFMPLENGKIRVVFQMHAEAVGSIPGWLANTRIVDAPFKTMQALRKQVLLDKHQNKTWLFKDR